MSSECPSRESLERLLGEALNESDRLEVEAHVERCATCQKVLDNLTIAGVAAISTSRISGRSDSSAAVNDPRSEAFFNRLKRIKPPTLDGHKSGDEVSGIPPAEQLNLLQVEGYEILGELGRGATGVVYRARHVKLNRLVALKVIMAGPNLSPEVRHRFGAEAQAVARLHHPHIVQIYDVGEHARRPYLSLELVEGGTLADWMGGKPQPADEAARVVETLAKAVEYAHNQGIIHRDLKPGNVLLSISPNKLGKRELKIADFGIAKVLPQEGIAQAKMTQTGEILGTPAYMAPEQARGNANEIVPATDIYSLGAMLYELLTGRPPFQGATALDTLMQATRQDPVSILLLVPRVPKDLNTICLKCLEKESAKRYQTAGELAADLGRFLKEEPIHARPLSLAGHGIRWMRRYRGLAAALAGVAFLLVLLTGGSLLATAHFRMLERRQSALALEKGELADQKEAERARAAAAEQHETELRQQAENEGQELRQNLYFDQMNFGAQAASSPSGIGRVSDWLAPWGHGLPDLRNWEWYFLNGLCHRDLMTLSGHSNGVRDVAWSPDGRRLASAGADETVRIWAASDGQELHRLSIPNTESRRVAWSPDGLRLASANWDGTVKIWNAETGEEVLSCPGVNTHLLSVAWSADGKHLATCDSDQMIRIWDAQTGAVESILHGGANDILDIAWSPDDKRLASTCANDIRIWDMANAREMLTLRGHTNLVSRIAWSPDGTKLGSASNDQTVKIWNPSTGAALQTLRGHVMGVSALAWSPDGKHLATSSDDQTIKIFLAAGGAELFTLRGHRQPVTSVAWSPDGSRLASSSSDATVKIWDAAAGPEIRSLAHAASVSAVAWSPDSGRLASGGADQLVRIWDPESAKQEMALGGHTDQVLAVAWSPDGKRVASAGDDHTIRLWDAISGKSLSSFHVDTASVCSLAWSPDGRHLASAGLDDVIRIWDPTVGNQIQFCQGHHGNVHAVVWSPDGKRLASASADQSVRVWDAATGQQTMIMLSGHDSEIYCVAWSLDGRMVASGGYDQTIRVWNAVSGQLMLILRGHTARVTGVAWSPDGTRLASASDDRTVKLWDVASGREVLSLDSHTNMVKAVAWSPDGLVLATAGDDMTVLLHDAGPGYLAERAPQCLPMLDRRLNDNSNDAQSWLLRSEIDVRRQDWPEAAIDLRRYTALNPAKKWYPFGYWVIGPYPDDLRVSNPPETDPDPGHALPPNPDPDPLVHLSWKSVPYDSNGFVDFGRLYNHAEHISAYALLRVYAPSQQPVSLLIGSDDQCRLWLNGTQVYQNLTERAANPGADPVHATLQAGWNTLLARVVNVTGEHALYLSISGEAADGEHEVNKGGS